MARAVGVLRDPFLYSFSLPAEHLIIRPANHARRADGQWRRASWAPRQSTIAIFLLSCNSKRPSWTVAASFARGSVAASWPDREEIRGRGGTKLRRCSADWRWRVVMPNLAAARRRRSIFVLKNKSRGYNGAGCHRYDLGARAPVVLLWDDCGFVSWLEQGVFCKTCNIKTAKRPPLYMPLGQIQQCRRLLSVWHTKTAYTMSRLFVCLQDI
jgi:hypothetical protein